VFNIVFMSEQNQGWK